MWISALVTLLNLGLAAVVGVRLLARALHGDRGPEGWLAGYFLCGAFLGSLTSISVYASLGPEGVDWSPAAESRLLAASTLLNSVAGACIYVFTWRTFRRGETWAAVWMSAGAAAFALAWLHQAATGQFVVKVVPGASYWTERTVYLLAFLWAAFESLRYHRLLRRRMKLGLAEPVLVNRFLLWGVWASMVSLQALAEVGARIAYYLRTGETAELLVEQAMPIIVATVAFTAAAGIVAAASLWLTFFPTRAYAHWIERHAEAA